MNNMYDILDKMKLLEGRGSKPDFLDLDKDGNRKEPMKQAARQAKVDEVVGPDYDVPPGEPVPDSKAVVKPIKEKDMGQSPVVKTSSGFSASAPSGQQLTVTLPKDRPLSPGDVKTKSAGMNEAASKTARMARIAKLCARDAFSNIDRKMFLKAAELFAAGDEQRGLDAIRRMDTEASDDFYMGCDEAGIPVPVDESALQAYLGRKKYGEAGMKALQQAGREGASKEKMARIRAQHDKMDEAEMGEGNDFTGARLAAIKAGKPTFSVGGKTYRVTGDTSDEKVMEKKQKTLWPGTPEYKEKFGHEMRAGEKRKSSTGGEIEKTASGVKHTRSYDDDEGEDKKADDGAPKKRGRPKGKDKGPERVTAKAWKHKGGRVKEGMEDEEMISLVDKGEYDREGDMAREQLHTVMDAAKELHSILDADDNLPEWVQSKITKALDYLDTARDYVKASDAEDHEVTEVAPPGAKAERMVKHIKKGYAKDGRLTPKEKSIAYATAWKAHKAGRVEEESDETRDERAEKAGRRVAKDIEYDERDHDDIHGKRRGSEDDKAERAGKKVTKDIEYDEKKKKEEVDETTTSGSVATAPAEAPKGKKGMIFGKGVYESLDAKYNQLLTEGMSINMSVGEDGTKSLSVNATDEDAVKLAQILKLAGMEQAHGHEEACPTCGQAPCGCEELEEDYANSPEERMADINTLVNTYSDGLNGQKTTGQTTIPVIAGQTKRMMSQVQEEAEQRLWNLYQRYDTK